MIDGESQFIPIVDVRLAGSRTLAKALKRAREDASVKAVVFRIETGTEIRAGDGNHGIALDSDFRSRERGLEECGGGFVANQRVRNTM